MKKLIIMAALMALMLPAPFAMARDANWDALRQQSRDATNLRQQQQRAQGPAPCACEIVAKGKTKPLTSVRTNFAYTR